jgi:UDP-N-acetylmuramoyl-tripeptide--D-alanyl-D-alanine ligase
VTDTPTPRRSAGEAAFDAATLATAVDGRLVHAGDAPIRGGAVDSRKVEPGVAFFALLGERTDGHRFVIDAARRGAGAIVVSEPPSDADLDALRSMSGGGPTVVLVADGRSALHAAARAWRARFEPLVVGVTGSLAKTSTKEQVAEVLARRWTVLRNEGNENNEIGVPLTLLRLRPEHEAAVLEMGMYVGGEIAVLAALARPSIGVVTAVRGTHLSRAGSLDAIERGKGELVEALPASGTAVLNADDPRVRRMAARTAARTITYGFDETADVRAVSVESLADRGMRFELCVDADRVPVTTPALGRHSVHNALAAAAVGIAGGLDLASIAGGLSAGFRAPHRSALVQAGPWRILDDSYNAAPDSMIAALELLATLPGRRVAVLGEMLELGAETTAAHDAVGRRATGLADRLVVVGDGAAGIAHGAVAAGMSPSAVTRVADRDEAFALLAAELRPGDVVLLKASRGVALDLLVERLVALATDTPAIA